MAIRNQNEIDSKLFWAQEIANAEWSVKRKIIQSKYKDLKNLSSCIADLMDTYHYIKHKNEDWGSKMWSLMCSLSREKYGLDFCNALKMQGFNECGVRPRKGLAIYVINDGVYVDYEKDSPKFGEAFYSNTYYKPIQFDAIIESMDLLITNVPKFVDEVINRTMEMDISL